jgi:hypothetical protein
MATKKKTPKVSSFWLRSYKLDKENKREAFIFFVQFIRWQRSQPILMEILTMSLAGPTLL